MVDPDNISDEYIGLPNGFMSAGSHSVVASLWKVGDIYTTVLMIKFYQNLKQHNNKFPQLEEGAVAIALNQAQRWFRDLTGTQFKQWIEKLKKDSSITGIDELYLDGCIYKHEREKQPFCNPYYWAAFCAIGQ